MLEATTCQVTAGAQWATPRRLRDSENLRVSIYSTEASGRNESEIPPQAFAPGDISPHTRETSGSQLMQPFFPTNFSNDGPPNYQAYDGNMPCNNFSYPYVGQSCFSASADPNTLTSTSPISPQRIGASNLRNEVASFSSDSSRDPAIPLNTSFNTQLGFGSTQRSRSASHLGTLGSVDSSVMASASDISPPGSMGYVHVNSIISNPEFTHELDELPIYPDAFFPMVSRTSPSSSSSISLTTSPCPDGSEIDLTHAAASNESELPAMPLTSDLLSNTRALQPQLLNQEMYYTGRNNVGFYLHSPWKPQSPFAPEFEANYAPTRLSPVNAEEQIFQTGDVDQNLLKIESYPSEPIPHSPGGTSESSWQVLSGYSSDVVSFDSPSPHRSPVARPMSSPHGSPQDFDQQYKYMNNAKITKLKPLRGRQRGLTPAEKKHARDVRDAKACWACHISKTKCSPCSKGNPCEQCARLDGKRRFCNFSCFNDPLETLHGFMIPDHLMGHLTRHNVDSFMERNAERWGTYSIHVRLYWGYTKFLEADVVAITARSNATGIKYHHQLAQDGTPHSRIVRKQSPPVGIPLGAMDSQQETYSRYISQIVANGLPDYVAVAYNDQDSKLAERLLGAACQYYTSKSVPDIQFDLIRRAIKMHITIVILERSLTLDSTSLDQVQNHLQCRYPDRSAPKCAQRQIKLAVFEPQRRRIERVLKDWGNMMWATNSSGSKDRDWAVSFTVFILLVLVIDKTIGAAFYYCKDRIELGGEDARAEKAEFDKLVKLIEGELFARFKEIFHWKFKTRKGGKEACNPIRDGSHPFLVKSGFVDPNVEDLVGNLQDIVKLYDSELERPMVKNHNMESPYMNAGRLASIFLNDFIMR